MKHFIVVYSEKGEKNGIKAKKKNINHSKKKGSLEEKSSLSCKFSSWKPYFQFNKSSHASCSRSPKNHATTFLHHVFHRTPPLSLPIALTSLLNSSSTTSTPSYPRSTPSSPSLSKPSPFHHLSLSFCHINEHYRSHLSNRSFLPLRQL